LALIGAPSHGQLKHVLQALLDASEHCCVNRAGLFVKYAGSRIMFAVLDNPMELDRYRGVNLAWFAIDNREKCRTECLDILRHRLRDPRAVELCEAVSVGLS